MPTPQLGLAALKIVSPVIPEGVSTLSVDTTLLALTIQADANTIAIDVSLDGVTTTLTSAQLVNDKYQFSGLIDLSDLTGSQTIEISGRNFSSSVSPAQYLITPTLQFELLYTQSNKATSIAPPTGVSVYKGQSSCRVEWATPTYAGFQGVRLQWSTDASGVNTPFQQYGSLITDISRSADVSLGTPTQKKVLTENQDGTFTETTTEIVQTATVNFSSVDIPSSVINADAFYVILSTLIQDPETNLVYESRLAGPFLCGFVDLKKVNPTDFLALQKQSDIAARMIANLTSRRPDLDLTAHSEVRDIIINPIAIELSNLSVREWFSRGCRSISFLAQVDDADGDGVSDSYDSSPVKQQIASAYGLSSTSVQTFIDRRFEILGETAGVDRGGPTTSVATLTFFTYSRPTRTLTISEGVVASTIPDATNTQSVGFVTRGSATIDPSNADAFYDAANQWWSVSVPAECQTPGAIGEVGARTIRQITAGAPSGMSVINLNPARGGTDKQSNSDYAAMIQNRQVAGKDTGSRAGYWETAMKIPGVTDALVVAAGDVDMLRDWSEAMDKHTYGCVDIYARGGSSSQQTEYIPLTLPTTATYGLYSSYLTLTLLSLSNLSFRVQNFLSLTAPIYAAVEIVATSAGNTVWLGAENAQFDNATGIVFLDPNETTYIVNADGTRSPWQIDGVTATNLQFIQAVNASPVSFYLMPQLKTGIEHTPVFQPVTAINSISGPVTGSIPSSMTQLVYTSDFLLNGGSNKAGDQVSVPGVTSALQTKMLSITSTTTPIDDNIALAIDANGVPQNIVSVRSADLSTVYTLGRDYKIVASGKYRKYSLQLVPGSAISPGIRTKVVVAYYRYTLRETVTLQTETLTLSGSNPTPAPIKPV